ncbi:glycosyltransferase [Amaricoccus solimangrovi]|uniref:Glycosyltransferase n=1 Tax=Amaricoccus solimangrovi TaxID=2589815 RepID=A0A501WIY5_9RHOB|nr:glycosyltransferase [Amaricoccus solimangrovi]TPE48395.1 glycosyltransferase [Amaricoccus solimangrovi]
MISDRLESAYLALPPALRRLIPEHWRTAFRDRLLPEWRRARGGGGDARALEDKLWGGFSASAAAELDALRLSFAAHPREAAQAAWILARFQATRGEFGSALGNIVFMRSADRGARRHKRQFLQEAKILCLLGRGAEARALLALRHGGFDPSIELMRAASHSATAMGTAWTRSRDEAAALAHLNAIFARMGLAELALRDPDAPLSIDNLVAAKPPAPVTGGPLVSVILPAYRAAETLPTALAALAAQSWREIEVLVVDDASPDATAEVARAFAARDPRFRLIRLGTNGGSYAARNRALSEARGEIVTVHDADDWSHPEKIRLQAEHLLREGPPHNLTAWTRALPDLMFTGTAQASRSLVSPNLSSHMIRREALIAAGGWDHIRVSGDTELIWRIEALAGRPREAWRAEILKPACPLSLGRLGPASLTGSEATHVLSIHHGGRREYREAAEHWHAGLRRGEGREALAELGVARFPAPPALRPDRGAGAPLDALLIGDFNLKGGTTGSALAMLAAGRAAGLAMGILHYRRYDLDVTRPLSGAIRDLARASGVRIVAPGERLRAATVILTHPPLLEHAMDRFPEIDHDALAVVVNQMAERDLDRSEIAYDPGRVRTNLGRLLGSEGHWLPISGRVRALMAGDPRYPRPAPATWTPLIDLEAWGARPPAWRGRERARPVLGRQGRDHALKWPRTAAEIRAAYCAGRACETRFLGGARAARARLGSWPGNWRVQAFGGDVPGFLADLDFFLHYPDPRYIEEFGRAALEAMAAGVPAILPPEFEPTFGPAALYAAPEEVWPLVERLWADEAAWLARAEAGRAFARETCDARLFPDRLAALAAEAPARAAELAEAELGTGAELGAGLGG